jgi:GGDEF domain-containing protein
MHSETSPEQTFNVTFSASLATLPPATQAQELLLNTDVALYVARQPGNNCSC